MSETMTRGKHIASGVYRAVYEIVGRPDLVWKEDKAKHIGTNRREIEAYEFLGDATLANVNFDGKMVKVRLARIIESSMDRLIMENVGIRSRIMDILPSEAVCESHTDASDFRTREELCVSYDLCICCRITNAVSQTLFAASEGFIDDLHSGNVALHFDDSGNPTEFIIFDYGEISC